MKNIKIKFTLFFLISFLNISLFAQNQQKEVLIIGTMHGVPKIVKNSYRPLLKKAKKYKPEAVFVEHSKPDDTLSLQKQFPWLMAFADSIRQNTAFDEAQISALQNKRLRQLKSEDFAILFTYFYANLDVANARYYKYLSEYGFKGRKEPSRYENQDLSFPLAVKMGLKEVYPMDFQHDRSEYGKTARQCYIMSQKDKESEAIGKTMKWNTIRAYFNGAIGRLAHHTNRPKTIKAYHDTNSMDFRKTDCEPCKESQFYWNKRNQMMVRNIGNEIRKNGTSKNIVIVGAGHVYGMKEYFEQEFPDIQVKLLKN